MIEREIVREGANDGRNKVKLKTHKKVKRTARTHHLHTISFRKANRFEDADFNQLLWMQSL